jgi:hypothetical protein
MYTIYPGGKNVSADGEQKELFFENRPGDKIRVRGQNSKTSLKLANCFSHEDGGRRTSG